MLIKRKFSKNYSKKLIIIKDNKILCFIILIQQLLIIILFHYFIYFYNNKNDLNKNQQPLNFIDKNKLDYENNTFIFLRRPCNNCGFFSHYKIFMSCIEKIIMKGFIPILDVISYPNVFNGFKAYSSDINPWELFFNQPFGYTYNEVIKKAKKIYYYDCKWEKFSPQYTNIYSKQIAIDFFHFIGQKYIPIKNEIIKEADIIINKLFGYSKNILGILIRGTDYIARKPKNHPIPPTAEQVIKDIKEMDKINKYDWIFLTTEDNIIRTKFINIFDKKLKYYLSKNNINYNYKTKELLSYNKYIKGNLENMKIYLINIIILSKCLDIITARTNGSIAAFILTEGFRNKKVYYLGLYKKNKKK